MDQPTSSFAEPLAIIRRQYEPALAMLGSIIDNCPEELWLHNPCGHPLWKRLLHTLESLDYYLADFGSYLFTALGKKVSPEFDAVDEATLSKNEMRVYFEDIMTKFTKMMSELTNDRLSEYSRAYPQFTYLDILLLQFRHLVFNTGCCDEVFAANSVRRTKWIGYCE